MLLSSEEESSTSDSAALVLARAEAETRGAGAEVGAGAVTTMAGPAKEVAAAADFSTEGSGAAGVAVDKFVTFAFAEVFDRVPGAALDWSFLMDPLRRR